MSSISFDPNGATKDRCFDVEEFKSIVDLLNENKGNTIKPNVIETFNEIYKHAAKQNDRSIHIVVTEPVEYEDYY